MTAEDYWMHFPVLICQHWKIFWNFSLCSGQRGATSLELIDYSPLRARRRWYLGWIPPLPLFFRCSSPYFSIMSLIDFVSDLHDSVRIFFHDALHIFRYLHYRHQMRHIIIILIILRIIIFIVIVFSKIMMMIMNLLWIRFVIRMAIRVLAPFGDQPLVSLDKTKKHPTVGRMGKTGALLSGDGPKYFFEYQMCLLWRVSFLLLSSSWYSRNMRMTECFPIFFVSSKSASLQFVEILISCDNFCAVVLLTSNHFCYVWCHSKIKCYSQNVISTAFNFTRNI